MARNPKNQKRYNLNFVAVDDKNTKVTPLLGSKAAQKMDLLTVYANNFERVNKVVNCVGAQKYNLDKYNTFWKSSFTYGFDCVSVAWLTEWVSSVVIAAKSAGGIYDCIDPQ